MAKRNALLACLLLLSSLLLLGCDRLPALRDAYSLPTLTPLATATPAATPTPLPSAGGVGLAFYRAWEGGDYSGMYDLLSPQSQALIGEEAFTARYQEATAMAGVQAIHIQPISVIPQERTREVMAVQVTWETILVGTIAREHTVELSFSDDRWGVVWDEGLILPELEGGNQLRMTVRQPSRANIYDINGQALAYQGTAVTLGVVPGEIEDEDGLLEVISPLLNQSPQELRARYAAVSPDWYVPLGEIASETMQAHYAELQPYLEAGLKTENRLTRLYAEGGIAPHAVGFVGPITAEELADYQALGYSGDEQVGRSGVEKWGESYLAGSFGGTLNVIGANGEYVTTVAETEPQQARSLYLTIDAAFQRAVEEALTEALESHPIGERGAAVVIDVHTGAIKAMASYPDFDPAIFDLTRPTAAEELEAAFAHPGDVFLNRVTQGVLPAGSIFKLVTFTAGLNSGLFTPSSTYHSTGSWSELGDHFIKYDWLAGGHGTVSLAQALVVSCNSCFYEVGYQLDGYDPYLLPETARQMGFGEPTGLEGMVEFGGLIPDPDWKLANQGEGWAPGDSVNMAIGQGFVLVTPLQIANMFAAFANGGTLLQPHIIERIGAGGGAPEEAWPDGVNGRIPLTDEQIAIVQDSLQRVTTSGAGTAAHIMQGLPLTVSGKTGTAESTPGNEPHAWFGGYAPSAPYTRNDGALLEEPEIAITVVIENAGEGSAVAAPIFRRIVELYYDLPLTPLPWE